MSLYTPVTENMKLDMRMNLKAKKVGIRQLNTVQYKVLEWPAAHGQSHLAMPLLIFGHLCRWNSKQIQILQMLAVRRKLQTSFRHSFLVRLCIKLL